MTSNNHSAELDKRWLSVHGCAVVDLDLSLVRSFVVTADQMHFGKAARELHITQQALSKRIRRLETDLGVPLFARTTRDVCLTPAGARFLPHALELLAAAEAAVLELTGSSTLLRLDVLDDRLAPMALVRQVLGAAPGYELEISMRRSLVAATAALERGELDLAFGRVQGLGRTLPPSLQSVIVRLEPLRVLVGVDHPLAGRAELRPTELRAGIWVPNPGSATEWDAYLLSFAEEFEVPLDFEEAAPTLEELAARIRAERRRVTVIGADMPLPVEHGLRTVALVEPEPVYPWSLVWRRSGHTLATKFVRDALDAGLLPRTGNWPGQPVLDLDRHWLPPADRVTVSPR
jgi:DNA-binding transcriptional LysR family regulator